jgi:threonine dehydratase
MNAWPLTLADVERARARLRPHLGPTPLLSHPVLDARVGHGVKVLVKHENHQPTGSFKVRNGLSAVSALGTEDRARGVVAATRGNHGLGLAWAGRRLGARVTICVPEGNNPEKNEGMRALGAELIERGRDYDEAALVATELVTSKGMRLVHSTNDRDVIAGAATMALEMWDQAPDLDALVIAVGGGSQAVGTLTVARELAPHLRVYAVQAAGASAIHDGWHAKAETKKDAAITFADGLATRSTYAMTFGALCVGLAGFVTVTDAEIAEAIRVLLSTTHNLAEGAGAAGLAGLMKLAPELAGQRVGVVLSGGNIDRETLRRVVTGEL